MKLKKWLKKEKMTGIVLAKKLLINVYYLNLIINGKRKPSLELANKICEITNNEVTLFELGIEQFCRCCKQKLYDKNILKKTNENSILNA